VRKSRKRSVFLKRTFASFLKINGADELLDKKLKRLFSLGQFRNFYIDGHQEKICFISINFYESYGRYKV